MTEQIRIKIGLDGVPQVAAGANAAAGALDKVGQAGARLGARNQLTGQQTAQLSAQLQDFFVQVQAGGNPLTALLQQGSQLSAVFGGTGNALKAVTSLITPAVVGVGALALGVGGLAAAYLKGYQQSKAFADALALTGNAAGVTEGQVNSLADSIGRRTQAGVGTAREALQALVASGKLAGEALAATAGASAALARATGESGAEAAKRLLSFTDSAAEGARKLNEQYNFLTVAQYQRIRALEEEGNRNQAVAETMRLLEGRISTTVQNLGSLERAWLGVKNAIGGAVDAALSIGRAQTPEGQAAVLRSAIEANQRRTDREDSIGPNGRREGADAQLARLQQQLQLLQKAAFLEAERANNAGIYAAQQRAGIAWIEEGNKYLSRRQQMEREIAQLRNQASAAGKKADDPELLRRIAAVTERYAEAKKKGANAFEVEQDAAKEWSRVMERAVDIQADAEGKTLELTEAQKVLVEYLRSPAYAANSEEMRQLAVNALKAAIAAEQFGKAQRASAKAAEEANKAAAQLVANYDRQADAAEAQLQRLQDEEKAAALAASANITLAEAIARVTLERLKEQQAGLLGNEAAYLAAQREIEAREKQAVLIRNRAAREGADKAMQEQQRAWERINEEIGQSLADALMEGGRSAREYLEGLFRTMVLRPILQAVISPVTGAVAALLSGGASTGGNGGAAALAGANNLSSLYSLYQAGTGYSGSVNALAGYLGAGTTAGASGVSLAYANAVGAAGGDSLGALIAANNSWGGVAAGEGVAAGSAGAGASAGAAAWTAYAAAFVAAYMGSRSAWEKGFNNDNLTGAFRYSPESTFTDLLKATGFSDRAANIWGGGAVYTQLFGRASPRVTGSGISGSITGGDFTGQAFRDILEKGGIFRSDRRYTETAALDESMGRFFDDAAAAVLNHAKKYGEALGLPAEQLASISADIRIALTDDVEKNKQAIAEALGGYGAALLEGFADEIAPLRGYGETVAQTIERVGGALLTVNDALSQLGGAPLAKSVSGAGAATALVGRFGNTEQFNAAVGAFYQAFTTETQKAQQLAAKLTTAFADMGLVLPDVTSGAEAAHAAYLALATAQDLTTEAGRNAFATMVALAPAFDAVAQSGDKAAKEAAERAKRVSDTRLDLDIELLQAQGNAQAALNLQRQRELTALRELDPALAQVKEAIYAAVDAANAAARAARVQGGADANVADFLSGPALQQYLAQRVLDVLGQGGITGDIAGVVGSTKEVVLDLWNAVGVEGKEAILEALPLWRQLMEVVNGPAERVKAYRQGPLAAAIEDARLRGLTPAQRVAALQAKEVTLKAKIGSAQDPVAVAQELQETMLQRIEAENELREEGYRSAREALEQQIEAQKQLKNLAADLRQFTGSLGSSRYSPLSARGQVESAASLFERTLAAAQSGDTAAIRNLQGNAQNYLDAASSAYASGPAYAGVYERVQTALSQFADKIDASTELSTLEAQLTALTSLDDTAARQLTALTSIEELLASLFPSQSPADIAAAAIERASRPSGPNAGFTEGPAGSSGGLTYIGNAGDPLIDRWGEDDRALLREQNTKLTEVVAVQREQVDLLTRLVLVSQVGHGQTSEGVEAVRDVLDGIRNELQTGGVPA